MSITRRIALHSFWLAFLEISFVSASALNLVNSPTLAASQALWNSSDLSEALPSLTNSTNSSTPFANRVIEYECSSQFGHGNYGRSCFDAVRRMAFVPGSPTRQFTWGRRDRGIYDVPLPQAIYSSDGYCSILVNPRFEGRDSARASLLQVQNGAAVVINNCIHGQTQPKGGSANNFNDDGNLVVDVDILGPDFPVECWGTMPPLAEASCKFLLNDMSASHDDIYFGPSSGPEVDVILPHTIVSPDGRCALTITSDGLRDRGSWWSIWDAGTELAGVCARQGKQGRDTRIGDLEYITVELFNPSARLNLENISGL